MDRLDVFVSSGPPSHDLAFEGELLEWASGGRCSVLVASWAGPVVVLGYAQPPGNVDLEWCRANGIPVLRRLSGGTGVIHRADLSLSLVLPGDHPWTRGIVGLYDRFLDAIHPGLIAIGSRVERVAEPGRATRVRSPICFEDQLADTLLVDGRKAVGCSQTRRRGGVLIHAAILLDLMPELYASVFGVAQERVSAGLAPAITGAEWRLVADALVVEIGRALDLSPSWSDRPRPARKHLAAYAGKRWSPVADDGIAQAEAKLV